jgi:hypothetical protein
VFQRIWDNMKQRPANAMCVGGLFLAFGTYIHWLVTGELRPAAPNTIAGVNRNLQEHWDFVSLMHRIEGVAMLIAVGLLIGGAWRKNRGLP